MKPSILLAFCCFICLNLHSQTGEEIMITNEGRLLYKIALADAHGVEIVKSKYTSISNSADGHIAYINNQKSVCVFYTSNPTKIIFSVSFDSQARIETASVDNKAREATLLENDLIAITQAAAIEITKAPFKNYGNSHFTILPIVDAKSKRAFVVTTSEREGVITFGNDYLITFSNDIKITGISPIHRNLMWTETQPKEIGKDAVESWHTHLAETGKYMTSTDVFMFLMNEKLTKWKRYSVISETMVSVWDCKTDKLSFVSKQQWSK